jgi:hypothetical protein
MDLHDLLQRQLYLFLPEDGSISYLRKVDNYLSNYAAISLYPETTRREFAKIFPTDHNSLSFRFWLHMCLRPKFFYPLFRTKWAGLDLYSGGTRFESRRITGYIH